MRNKPTPARRRQPYSEKVHVAMPKHLSRRLDEEAEANQTTRSHIARRALWNHLRPKPESQQ